jgi:hypothetical protein
MAGKQQQGDSGGWYNRGIDDEKLKKAESENKGGTRRFWMPPESTRKIIMLDDEPFCFPEGTMIQTDGGFKPIEDISVGDLVVSANGDMNVANEIYHTMYEGDMVSIGAVGLGERLISTADHRVAVVVGSECKYKELKGGRRWCLFDCKLGCHDKPSGVSVKWVPAKDVKVGDQLLMPISHERKLHNGEEFKFSPNSILPGCNGINLAWWIGLYVAEGHISKGGAITITLNKEEEKLIEIAKCGLSLIGCKTISTYPKESNAIQIVGYNKEVSLWLGSICGIGAENKKIPYGFFSMDRKTISDVFDGYYQGDGSTGIYNGQPRCTAVTVSRELGYQIRSIVLMFGGKPIFSTVHGGYRNGANHQDYYRIGWTPKGVCEDGKCWEPDESRGRLRRVEIENSQTEAHEPISGEYLMFPVESVDIFKWAGPVYNFACSETNQTYVAGGVAVHNCIHEHNPKINGQFKDNWFTCRKGADINDLACPMCSSKVRRYYIGFITVLDATGWQTKKDNKLVIYQRQLFPMKVESLKRFKILKHKKTHLVGAMFDVTRTDDRSPQCGDMFDFEEYVDLNDEKYWFDSRLEGKKKQPEPFNYLEVMKPLSSKEMMSIGIGGDDLYGKGDSSSDDDSDGSSKGGDDDTVY